MPIECTAPEEWRAVVGYESHYEVSNLGRVRRIRTGGNTWPGRVLKARPKQSGRLTVSLSGREHYINRLVASAFIRPPLTGEEANHIDGIKTHDWAVNLEWVTRLGNIRHAIENGLRSGNLGEVNGRAKVTADDVRNIRATWDRGRESLPTMGARYGISTQSVWAIVHRKSWRHVE